MHRTTPSSPQYPAVALGPWQDRQDHRRMSSGVRHLAGRGQEGTSGVTSPCCLSPLGACGRGNSAETTATGPRRRGSCEASPFNAKTLPARLSAGLFLGSKAKKTSSAPSRLTTPPPSAANRGQAPRGKREARQSRRTQPRRCQKTRTSRPSTATDLRLPNVHRPRRALRP